MTTKQKFSVGMTKDKLISLDEVRAFYVKRTFLAKYPDHEMMLSKEEYENLRDGKPVQLSHIRLIFLEGMIHGWKRAMK